ncbi:phage tail protein [Pseudoduganella sp. FT55W]|uniref:Phage tail protein n=1 Tax=Duganella rivi TaxID=2666083 RepID=A0A7X4KER2_9BURK|nr:tail protein X [Duganella rivi]MYM70525.1 phage tail protein [Duganella rivi]
MRVTTQQGDTVDLLCWRHRKQTAGIVEATLELNPGLADYGPVLPHGLVVELPDPQTAKPKTNLINLWD